MSDSEVTKAEGAQGIDLDDGDMLYEIELLGSDVDLEYDFTGRRLSGAIYAFRPESLADGRRLYHTLSGVLSSKYGEADETRTATDMDLRLGDEREETEWLRERTRVVLQLLRSSHTLTWYVRCVYIPTDASAVFSLAARDLSVEGFQPSGNGRGDWRSLRWGVTRDEVELAMGEPVLGTDGNEASLFYRNRWGRVLANEFLEFGEGGGLGRVTLTLPVETSPTLTELFVIQRAVSQVYGTGTDLPGNEKWSDLQQWDTDRGTIITGISDAGEVAMVMTSKAWDAARQAREIQDASAF